MKLILNYLVLSCATFAFAVPTKIPKEIPKDLEKTFTSNYDFEGIVGLSNCSGSIVRFENSKSNEPAMILTNGHCYEGGFMNANTFISNKSSSRTFSVLNKNASKIGTVSASKVIYASMTGTDMTLYRLTESYDEIRSKYGITPLTLSPDLAPTGTPIEVISGYWKKGYTCAVSNYVNLIKEDQWIWKGSLKYTQPGCEIIGGTSGSPVVEKGTRRVVAVNNTVNENGLKCSMNNPCEVDSTGNISYQKGNGYAQLTHIVYTCLNENNELDLNMPECQLYH